jgi:hypothetical protein
MVLEGGTLSERFRGKHENGMLAPNQKNHIARPVQEKYE